MTGQRLRQVHMINKGWPSLYRRLQFWGRNETGSAQMDIKPLIVFFYLLMTVAKLLVKKTNKYCHLYLNRLDRGEWPLLQKVTSVVVMDNLWSQLLLRILCVCRPMLSVLSQTNTIQTSDTPIYNTFADIWVCKSYITHFCIFKYGKIFFKPGSCSFVWSHIHKSWNVPTCECWDHLTLSIWQWF